MRKYLLLILLLGWQIHTTEAQQSPGFLQYLYNESAFNPAVAGVYGTEVFLLHRQEWTGLSDGGTFSSQVIGGSLRPFGEFQRVGFGAMLLLDQAHIIQTGRYSATFAYQVLDGTVSPHRLSIGILGGVIDKRLDFNAAQVNNPFDAFLFGENFRDLNFNYGAGIHYIGPVGTGTLIVSAATTQGNNNFDIRNPEGDILFGLRRNIIGTARYNFPLNDQLAIEPAVMYRTLLLNSDIQDDIVAGVRVNYDETLWGGLTFSTASSAVGITLGVSFGKAQAGAAAELPLGELSDVGGINYEAGFLYRPGIKERPEKEEMADQPVDSVSISEGPAREEPAIAGEEVKPEEPTEEEPAVQPAIPKEPVLQPAVSLSQLISKFNQSDAVTLKIDIGLEVLSGPDGNLNVVTYKYIDLYSGYNEIEAIENLIEHLLSNVPDWRSDGLQISSISITTNSRESEQVLSRQLSTIYEGDLGDISDIPYQVNGQNINVTISPDTQITLQQLEYLKLYRLYQAFEPVSQNIKLRFNSSRNAYSTSIEFILK